MSVRFTADHVTTETGLTVTIEILDADFVGTATKGKGVGGSFASFSHQQLDPRDPHSSPIQSGELSASVYIRNATEQTLLNDILNANESRFRMRYYIGATLQWQGFILPDLSSYDEDRTPYIATFVAKDFTSLKGIDYPLTTGRATLISVLSDILDQVDLGVNIVADTSFSNSGIVEANDYLRQIYIDRTALRTFARTGDEPDETISYYDALSKVLSNNRLVLKQANGVFNVAQFTAYATPTAVVRSIYNASGSLVTQTTSNITQTGQRVTLQSVNNGNPGIKRADVRFDHRTTVSGIQFPSTFRLTDDPLSRVFTQFYVTDGTQALQLTGLVRAQFPDTVTTAKVLIQIRALSRYWNTSTNAWQVGAIANPLDMTDTELSGDKLFFERPISILTSNTPDTAGNDIEITVFVARQDAPAVIADFTDFSNFRLEIVNPSVAEGNSTAIDYELIQTGDFSINNSAQSAWFGDGPTSYALSAYSYDSAGLNLTASNWRRRGEAVSLPFFELHLREAIDLQRSWTRRISAEVKSDYNASAILSYDGIFFAYLGGTFDLYRGVWNVELLRVNIQTSVTDTFSIIYRTTSDASTGSAPASGGSGTSGGITQAFADARYNQRLLNLSDVSNVETARTNLDVYNKAHVDGVESESVARDVTLQLGLNYLSTFKTDAGTQINTTAPVSGGGDLTADRTIALNYSEPIYLNGSQLDIRDASSIVRGLVNTDPQTFAGAKTFLNDIRFDAGVRVNTGIIKSPVTLRLEQIGSTALRKLKAEQATEVDDVVTGGRNIETISPLSGGGNLTAGRSIELNRNEPLYDNAGFLDVLDASATARGVVTTGAQVFAGSKTFQDTPVIGSGIVKSPSSLRIEDTSSTALRKIIAAQGTATNEVITTGRSISTTAPLSGGGNLTADRTIALSFNSPLYDNAGALDVRDHATGQRGVLLPSAQSIFGDKTFQANAKLADAAKLISEAAFTPGFTGSGLQLEKNTGEWNLELDNMFIRGALFASEFIINQISALNGSEILSPGRGKVEEIVTATPGEEQLVIADPQGGSFASFAVDDIVIIQQFRPNDSAIVKRIVRQVIDVSTNNIILDTTAGGPADTGTIDVGDLIVAVGNATNTARQSSIYRSVVDANNPFTRVFTGVASWADWLASSKIALAYGNLNGSYGYVADTFGFAAGANTAANLTIDPTNGLRLRAGSDVLAQLSGTTFKVGTSNYIEFDSSDGVLDINTTVLSLTTANMVLDSSVPKIVLGASAGTQTLLSGTGFFVNGTGEIRAGATDGSNMTFDTTNGLRFRSVAAVLAQLNGTTFKIGTTNFIQFDSSDGVLDIDTAKFKLTTAGLIIDSTGQKIVLGASASTQTLLSGTGVFADGVGSLRVGSTVSSALERGLLYSQTTNRLDIRTEYLDVTDTIAYDIESFIGDDTNVVSGGVVGVDYASAQSRTQVLTMPTTGIALTGASFTQIGSSLPTYPTTATFDYQYRFSIQGRRVSDGIYENISSRILIDESILWDDPCMGSEPDPCQINYDRTFAEPLIAFPDEKYDAYQLIVENTAADGTRLNSYKRADVVPKTTIGQTGLFSGEIGAVKRIRIVESADEYIRFITERTNAGQLRLVARFYRDNAFVGEEIIGTK